MTFDYAASAELFMPKRKPGARQPLSYRRFATAAEAIRFAVASTATTSGACTRAPVTRGAVACENRGEIVMISTEMDVVDS